MKIAKGISYILMLFSAIAVTTSFCVFAQEQPLIVNIDNPNFRKLIVAVPDFQIENPDGEMAQISQKGAAELQELLNFSGLFNVISEKAYTDLMAKMRKDKAFSDIVMGSGGNLKGIDVPQWKAIGVESLTLGQLGKDKDGYTLAIRTVDINRSQTILGKKYSKIKSSEISLVVRRYADLLLQAYTGKPGIFSTKLVFVGRKAKSSSKQIYISDFDGSNVVQITNKNVPHLSPNWSRDGKFLTYTSYEDGNPDLFIHELATGKRRKLSGSKGLNSGGNWAPADKLIAFTGSVDGNADIFYVEPKGGKRKVLISGSGLDVDPEFSMDGKYLAFVSGRYGNPHIFRATLKWDGDKVTVLGDKRLTYAGWYNATPAWSPESDKLAFAGYDRDIDRFDLFMMDPDGKSLERLTIRAGDNESPSWSPNGQMLVFHSNRTDGKDIKGVAQIFMMNRDGSSQRKIDTGLYEAQTPKWSPPLD